ncbi:MAG TPA: hypothetical protein VKM93_27150 [Terriglobia bacterium]|nr:hypothetical protein [Terriglobia bacterium]
MSTSDPKEQAHQLIERLPPAQVAAVVGLLEAMLDPVSRAVANAPTDEEPLTAEESRALDDAQNWLKHNRGIPHERVLAELGITQKAIDSFKEPREADHLDRAGQKRCPAFG